MPLCAKRLPGLTLSYAIQHVHFKQPVYSWLGAQEANIRLLGQAHRFRSSLIATANDDGSNRSASSDNADNGPIVTPLAGVAENGTQSDDSSNVAGRPRQLQRLGSGLKLTATHNDDAPTSVAADSDTSDSSSDESEIGLMEPRRRRRLGSSSGSQSDDSSPRAGRDEASSQGRLRANSKRSQFTSTADSLPGESCKCCIDILKITSEQKRNESRKETAQEH